MVMTELSNIKRAHCVGIGGIHVSAVARLLKSRGVLVTGSDAVASDETNLLEQEGIVVTIGHGAGNVPSEADVVIYSHAAPEDNPEIVEAKKRGISVYDTHAFLGELFKNAKQIVVTGTHGKSTTTAMIGTILIAAGENPTVVVGTKVPGFSNGNLHVGRDDLLVVEGDEYHRHVLSYSPSVLVLNNMELDHTDIFPTFEAYAEMFGQAIDRVRDGGEVVWNQNDAGLAKLVEDRKSKLESRNVSSAPVGRTYDQKLLVPGEMNARNAAMAAAAVNAWKSDIDPSVISRALAGFPGVWRRFEKVGELDGVPVISDYGHHPTEVRETLKAAKAAFPEKRLILCFQPHQRNRTKHLFNDFVGVFNGVDVLILAEIYDVPGREAEEDKDVSSRVLLEAVEAWDRQHQVERERLYVPDLTQAEAAIRTIVKPGDAVIVMGAGTIDGVARRLVRP